MAAKISGKTVQAINSRCKNMFHFDIRTFQERNEKQLCRVITLIENHKIVQLSLYWTHEIIRSKNKYGCSVPQYTGNFFPKLHCAVWRKLDENGILWNSFGLGKFHDFPERPSAKRLMNALADATALVTDDLILSMLPEREQEEYLQVLARTNTTE